MQESPGKLDCTRTGLNLRGGVALILLFVSLLFTLGSRSLAQVPTPPQYPEVAWLTQTSYCNPYFGFRLTFPKDIKSEPIYLPVQSHGRHVLLALHLQRLERVAEILVSAFEDPTEDPAHLAARARIQQAHSIGLSTTGPHSATVGDHKFYRLHIVNDASAPGSESSFYLELRGYVLHFAIFTHDPTLAAAIESAIEHLEFTDPGPSACPIKPLSAEDHEPPRPYYGPALPTELVESALRQRPEPAIPEGRFFQGTFTDSALGVRLVLPPGWQPMPNHEADRITELMRDPTNDPERSDHRRALFRVCSRIVFAATDPATELISQVHPAIAIAAMPVGCVPDLSPPRTLADHAASEAFATLLVRSLGVPLLGRGKIHQDPGESLTFSLDGTLPFQVPGERLARRLSLRVSAKESGSWIIFVYSVTSGPSALRELESRMTIGTPPAIPAK